VKRYLIVALLLIIGLSLSRPVQAAPPGPYTISTPIANSSDQTNFESSYLSNSFYAQGLYWLFYESGSTCEHQTGCLQYVSSNGNGAWSTSTNVGVHITDSDFSVITDGSSAFYVRYNETSFETTCGQNLLVRVGSLSTAGSISWQSEITVATANSHNSFPDSAIAQDSNGQIWLGYMIANLSGCGGNGTDRPEVIHSAGVNYQSWTGNTTLTTAHSNLWHVSLVSLGSGQMYATYWIATSDIHGALYNGASWGSDEQISNVAGTVDGVSGNCTGGVCTDVNVWTYAQGAVPMVLYFDNTTKLFYVITRNSGVWTPPGVTAGTGDKYAGLDCCGAGAVYFSTDWYSLPTAAAYDSVHQTFYLLYLEGVPNTIDLWSGTNATGSWSKTTAFQSSTTAITGGYENSITAFAQPNTGYQYGAAGMYFWTANLNSPWIIESAPFFSTAAASSGGGGGGGSGGGGGGGSGSPGFSTRTLMTPLGNVTVPAQLATTNGILILLAFPAFVLLSAADKPKIPLLLNGEVWNRWKLKPGLRLASASFFVASITVGLDYVFHLSLTSPMEVPVYFAMKFFSSLAIAFFLIPRIGTILSALAFTIWVDVYYGLFVVLLGIYQLSSSPNQVIPIVGIMNQLILFPLWTLAHGFFFLVGAEIATQLLRNQSERDPRTSLI
jgi:hypothetical protein